jgi:Protein of unknown function (DUF3168)
MSSYGVQVAIVAALTAAGSDDLASLVGARVYNDVPKDAAYPFVVAGYGDEEEAGTSDSAEVEHRVEVHIWSRYQGETEILKLIDAIRARLHGTRPSVAGVPAVYCLFERTNRFTAEDGVTRRAAVIFRIFV